MSLKSRAASRGSGHPPARRGRRCRRPRCPDWISQLACFCPTAASWVAVYQYDSLRSFSPPYLFRGPRPSVAECALDLAYNRVTFVGTSDAQDIGSSPCPCGSCRATRSTKTSDSCRSHSSRCRGVDIIAPADANVAPPGTYLRFFSSTRAAFRPSARFVNLAAEVDGPSPDTSSMTAQPGNALAAAAPAAVAAAASWQQTPSRGAISQ